MMEIFENDAPIETVFTLTFADKSLLEPATEVLSASVSIRLAFILIFSPTVSVFPLRNYNIRERFDFAIQGAASYIPPLPVHINHLERSELSTRL